MIRFRYLLHAAAKRGFLAIVRFLVEEIGVSPDAPRPDDGESPLFSAVGLALHLLGILSLFFLFSFFLFCPMIPLATVSRRCEITKSLWCST
jgi:hypothetical protein